MADRSPLVALGALNAAIAVAAGAFAAHGLRDRLEARALEVFETAARYHLYHALAMVLAGALTLRGDHPGALADLAPGEVDPLDEQELELAAEAGQPPWYFNAETPLPALELVPDVWVFGNPPQARANPGAVPRIKAVFDEATITR